MDTPHAQQIRSLSLAHGMPGPAYAGALEGDAARIAIHPNSEFVFALSPFGTALYWFHEQPNEWGSLTGYLRSTRSNLPGGRYWLIGVRAAPIELGEEPNVREILSHLEGGS